MKNNRTSNNNNNREKNDQSPKIGYAQSTHLLDQKKKKKSRNALPVCLVVFRNITFARQGFDLQKCLNFVE